MFEKICKYCGKQFTTHQRRRTVCTRCNHMRQYLANKKYTENNQEKVKAYQKIYQKEWRKNNQEKIKAYKESY